MTRPARAVLAAALIFLVLASCTGGGEARRSDDDDARAAQTAPTVAGATTVPRLTAPGATAPPSTRGAARKVNANVADRNDLVAALEANGVADPGRWAGEVVANRPYATNDPSFTKLRQNLATRGADADTIDRVVSSLSL